MPGVYLSYPFCRQKCTFCNFASGVAAAGQQERYHRALLEELQRHRWDWHPDTVYWGGGTPSLMPLDSFGAVMRAIPSQHWLEVTVECAPGTMDESKVEAWRSLGVNRVSLGVQSFVAEEAKRTGRSHTPEGVERDIAMLRRAGIENISVDLIAGLPGQTWRSWRQSLEWVERLAVPHASVYIFEIDEDSRLGRETLLGGVRYGAALLPLDDAVADFYEHSVDALARIGLNRYEVSNFARDGFESRHNLKYWRREPYAGFGVEAHSFDGRLRAANTDDLETYLSRIEAGESPVEQVTASNPHEEHFFLGLRQIAGIVPTEDEWHTFATPIERGITNGLLERNGETLKLTDHGILLSNEVFEEFLL